MRSDSNNFIGALIEGYCSGMRISFLANPSIIGAIFHEVNFANILLWLKFCIWNNSFYCSDAWRTCVVLDTDNLPIVCVMFRFCLSSLSYFMCNFVKAIKLCLSSLSDIVKVTLSILQVWRASILSNKDNFGTFTNFTKFWVLKHETQAAQSGVITSRILQRPKEYSLLYNGAVYASCSGLDIICSSIMKNKSHSVRSIFWRQCFLQFFLYYGLNKRWILITNA